MKRQEHWQVAVHHLLLAAERGEIMMLAQMTIHHRVEREPPRLPRGLRPMAR